MKDTNINKDYENEKKNNPVIPENSSSDLDTEVKNKGKGKEILLYSSNDENSQPSNSEKTSKIKSKGVIEEKEFSDDPLEGSSRVNNTKIDREEFGLDPYKTYEDSPIPSDRETTDDLIERYDGNKHGLLDHQDAKMNSFTEKSMLYLADEIDERLENRKYLDESDIKGFNKESRRVIKSESEQYKQDMSYETGRRDDALDLTSHRLEESDGYVSGSQSEGSVDRFNERFDNLDAQDEKRINDHSAFTNYLLTFFGKTESESDNDDNSSQVSENSAQETENYPSSEDGNSNDGDDESSNNGFYYDGPSDNNNSSDDGDSSDKDESDRGNSNKRKREDSDLDEDQNSKKVKTDNETESGSNKRKREDSGSEDEHESKKVKPEEKSNEKQSPLDYVLEKQQCDPYDFTDDFE